MLFEDRSSHYKSIHEELEGFRWGSTELHINKWTSMTRGYENLEPLWLVRYGALDKKHNVWFSELLHKRKRVPDLQMQMVPDLFTRHFICMSFEGKWVNITNRSHVQFWNKYITRQKFPQSPSVCCWWCVAGMHAETPLCGHRLPPCRSQSQTSD